MQENEYIVPSHLQLFFKAGRNFDIFLNDTIYYEGGQTVTGNIQFQLFSEKSNIEIGLVLVGEERVNWAETFKNSRSCEKYYNRKDSLQMYEFLGKLLISTCWMSN